MAETGTASPEIAAPPASPDRTVTTDWRAGLPEDLRAEKSLESFKDVGALAKSYVETKRMVGDAVKVPGADAKPDEWAAFYAKAGRPEAPEKYAVRAPVFPEDLGIAWDQGLQASFLAEAHAAGFSNAQAQRMVDWYGAAMLRARDSEIVSSAEAEKRAAATMRQEWGSAYDRNLGLARAAAADLFGNDPEVLAAFEARGNNPAVLKGLHRIGEMLFERGEIRGDAIGGGRTEAELEAEILKIRDDPKNAGNIAAGERIVALTTELLRLRDRAAR